jgi:hypothetical protein
MNDPVGLFFAMSLYVTSQEMGKDNRQYNQYLSASREAFNAGYVQSGLKPAIDKSLKDIERKYISKDLAKYGSITAIIIKTISEERLTLTWSF